MDDAAQPQPARNAFDLPGPRRGQGVARAREAPVREVVLFVVVAYAFTWAVWVPRALHDQGVIDAPGVGPVAAGWTWAPALAAVTVAALTGGRSALRDLGRRLVRWRVPPLAWAAALLGPVALWALVLGLHVLLGGQADEVRPGVATAGLGGVLPLLLVLWLTDGVGEETGWRGYALPRLLRRVGPVGASCVLGVVWAGWHLPLLWTDGVSLEGQPFPLVLLDCLLMAVLYTWLFLHSYGSALLAVVLHGGLNAFAPPYPQDGDPVLPLLLALGVKAVVAAAAVLALRRTKTSARSTAPTDLDARGRPSDPAPPSARPHDPHDRAG